MKALDLSLVIACYNEEKILEASIIELESVLENAKFSYEVILIDDKSKDNTLELIKRITKRRKKFRFFFHKVNYGRGKTVSDGIKKAKGKVVGFIDIDLEVSPVYIPDFVARILEGEADIVTGYRIYRESLSSLPRAVLSRGYSFLVRKFLGIPLKDTETGYKFFNRSKIYPVLKEIKDKKWFWDTEIIAKSYFHDLRIKEIPVIFKRRTDKKSTVKVVEDTILYLKNLWLLKKNMNLSSFPRLRTLSLYRNDVRGLLYTFLKCLFWPVNEMGHNLPKDGTILDLGCGEGVFANYLAISSPNRKIVGIDISSSKLRIANKTIKKRKNIRFLKSDIMHCNLPRCDGIIVSDFFHHLQFNMQELLAKNSIKALKKNGVLVIKEVDKNEGIRHILSRFWDFILYPKDIIYYRGRKEWEKYLRGLGFDVYSKKTSLLSPFSTVLFIAIK